MIDINELRQLAKAATPGPWVSQGRYIGTPRHMSYVGEVRDQCGNWSDTEKSRADSAFIAAANPAAISELLDRLEAAEKERDWHAARCEDAMNECAALQAKAEQMVRRLFCDCKTDEEKSTFFLSGRAVETGVIAAAISNEVAMAYHRCAEFQKEIGALRAELLEKLASANRAVEEAYQRGYAIGQEEIEKERDSLRAALQHEADCVEAAKAEIKALRAKIAEMERQEPVGEIVAFGEFLHEPSWKRGKLPHLGTKLYALPGAQPAPSVPDGWKLVPIEPTPAMKTAGIGVEVYQDSPPSTDCLTWGEVEAIYSAMLAAAPEAKP